MKTPTVRTEQQRLIGIYWAYDGTPSLCAPPRLYNQIAVQIARERGTKVREIARLLALVNVAMADAGIAIWESKYYYDFWRPVTGIREADPETGPTGAGDGNPATVGDPEFVPLGAPASNLTGPNFTPPFPAYPSGHAGFGGALFQILREFYGTDRHRVHVRLGRVERRDAGERRHDPAAGAAAVLIALGGRRGERPEPHLPRHPLVVRQDRGHRPGTAGGELRLQERVRARAARAVARAAIPATRGAQREMRLARGAARFARTRGLPAAAVRFTGWSSFGR